MEEGGFIMVVIHYAGIEKNKTSGVSMIIPEIINAQANYMKVCLYNYGESSFEINKDILVMNKEFDDDYHGFMPPFNKPDIVVFHSPFGIKKSTKIARMLDREKIPYIIVPHGCFSSDALKKKKIKKWIAVHSYFNRMFNRAKNIQFLSKGEQSSSIYKKKGIIIPNAIRLPLNVKCKEVNSNHITIIFIGRKDVYHKGIDMLLNACGKIKNELKKNNISIYLYGPYQNNNKLEIQNLILNNNLENIVFDCPPIYDNEKDHIFREADLLVLTSRFEGLPGVVLEAWSYGCPTLLSQGSNMAEEAIENNCGWESGNTENSIKKQILNIIRNQNQIKEKSKSALKYVEKTYNWIDVAKKYEIEYKKIIEG